MNLKYSVTYEFSSADIFDATDPPLFFEAVSRPDSSWARLVQQWQKNGAGDPEMAEEIIGRVIVGVRQEGEQSFPLDGRKGAASLRAAIEANNPGAGDQFLCHLALGHYNHHFTRLADILGNSETPSPQSGDGASQTSPNGQTEKQPVGSRAKQ